MRSAVLSRDKLPCDKLSCEKHDYLEILCMFHYVIAVTDKSGQTFKGKACDILINEERAEVLVLQDPASEVHLPTNEISSINILTPDARIQHIEF